MITIHKWIRNNFRRLGKKLRSKKKFAKEKVKEITEKSIINESEILNPLTENKYMAIISTYTY